MRVLIVNQVPEANNKYTYSLARSVSKYGATVAVYGIEDDDYTEYQDVKTIKRFDHYGVKKNALTKILSYIRGWRGLVKWCKNKRIDIVHVQWYSLSFVDYYCHRKLQKHGIKIVATIHDLLPFRQMPLDYYFYRKIYNNADMLISQAVDNEKKLIADFNVPREKFQYIPHGNYVEYAEMVDKNTSRDFLKLPKDKKLILFFGQIKKVKGLDVLLKAIGLMRKRRNDFVCLIAGKTQGEPYERYQKLIDDLKINDVVRSDIKFIPDEEIKYYFGAADVVALPYLKIFQSGVLQLTYAYEKPVVCTDRGELKTLVKDRENGLVVSAGDYKALADSLEEIIDNPELGLRIARQGKEFVEKQLNWDMVGKRTLEVYNSVLAKEGNSYCG